MSKDSQAEDSFRKVLANFKKRLTKQEIEDFKVTSLDDLHAAIDNLQAEQAARKECMNMARMRSFLEAAEQLGTIVEVFLNTTEFLAFVWGPMKFLLKVSASIVDGLCLDLHSYSQMESSHDFSLREHF
jgi:hypothetical protein